MQFYVIIIVAYLEFEAQKEALISRELQSINKTLVYEYHVNDLKP